MATTLHVGLRPPQSKKPDAIMRPAIAATRV